LKAEEMKKKEVSEGINGEAVRLILKNDSKP
jgi:hypothetical protein